MSETSLIVQWVTNHPYGLLGICAGCLAMLAFGILLCVPDDKEGGPNDHR